MRIVVGFLCALLAVPAHAQPRTGTLRLVVRDATDLTIQGATVTLTGPDGSSREVVANDRGELSVDLAPGVYVATIESPGFRPAVVKDLRVRSAAQFRRP